MSLTYGFYNSLNGDRVYNADQFSSIFDGIIRDGVFQNIGERFAVTASSDLTLNVGTGRAWFNGTWTLNTAQEPVTLKLSDALFTRIDAVVLDINSSTARRENTIQVVQGTPSEKPNKPELIRTPDHNQYALAYVTRRRNTEVINQEDIQNAVGLEDTPFVTGILEVLDASIFINQWTDQWNRWMDQAELDRLSKDDVWTQWLDTIEQDRVTKDEAWLAWLDTVGSQMDSKYDDFDAWFLTIQDVLSGDVAGNLLVMIEDIPKVLSGEAEPSDIRTGDTWLKELI